MLHALESAGALVDAPISGTGNVAGWHCGARAAAPDVFIQAGYGQGHVASEEIAIRHGFKAMERGVDAIYFAGSFRIVEAMAREGIPVTGHIAYVPRWNTWTGVRSVGKTNEEAVALYRQAKSFESAAPGRSRWN